MTHELQNNLCNTFDGIRLEYGEAKWGNWPKKKTWLHKVNMFSLSQREGKYSIFRHMQTLLAAEAD